MSSLARAGRPARLVRRRSRFQRELVKVSAFFLRNWRMTYRNVFTVFEIVFWPIVNLLSVGLLTTFLDAEPGTVVFVLVGTFALSTVQVCQLDVAYAGAVRHVGEKHQASARRARSGPGTSCWGRGSWVWCAGPRCSPCRRP